VASQRRLVGWLCELQDHQAEMRGHEHTPLHLVQRWSELAAGTALFDHVLVFENYPGDEALAGFGQGLAISGVTVDELTNYPLTLTVTPRPELTLEMVGYANRFTGAELAALLARFAGLLRAFAGAADPRLGELPLLSPGERHQLLVEWNDTAVAWPRPSAL